MSLTLKISSLFVRTLAKPIANAIKRNAHEHERFRKVCVKFAQGLHRIDMRMRLGLLQDPKVIEKEIQKEVAAAEARRRRLQAPTVKTEAEAKVDEQRTEKEKEAIRKKTEAAHKPRVRPLSEAKAIEMGANFVSEAFIFAVGISVILIESWRQRRKQSHQRSERDDQIEAIQTELAAVKAELEQVKAQRPSEPKPSRILGFLGGRTDSQNSDTKKQSDEKHEPQPPLPPPAPLLPSPPSPEASPKDVAPSRK